MLATLLTALLCIALVTPLDPASAATGRVATVTVLGPRWASLTGQVPVGVRVAVRGHLASVRARLSLVDATGRVRWASTRTRSALDPATYDFSFTAPTGALGLATGAYTLQATVTSGSGTVVRRSRSLLVADRSIPPVPVTVIVRVAGTPEIGPAGSLAADPEAAERTRSDAAGLARLALVRPDFHLTATIPAFLLAEWQATASAPAAVATTATPTASTPEADVVQALRGAVVGGMPLLRSMYAEPDLTAAYATVADARRQLIAGDLAQVSAIAGFDATASMNATGFDVLSGLVPQRIAPLLAQSGIRFFIADPASVRPSGGTTATSAPYRIVLPATSGARSTTLTALVVDRVASEQLGDRTKADALATYLLTRATSKAGALPVTIEVSVGPGGLTVDAANAALDALSSLPWVRLVDAPTAAADGAAGRASLRTSPSDATPAPASYEKTVLRAKERVDALVAASTRPGLTPTSTVQTLMLAESRVWADVDGSWGLADRGLAYATAADRTAWGVLSKVTIEAPSVTLPGSDGRVPVSLVNGSDRVLTVTLTARSDTMRVRTQHLTATLQPGENIRAISVGLGTATSGQLRLAVDAGSLRIASRTATVSASYLDRIVLLCAVVLVLIGLLVYIRRRMLRGARSQTDEPGSD